MEQYNFLNLRAGDVKLHGQAMGCLLGEECRSFNFLVAASFFTFLLVHFAAVAVHCLGISGLERKSVVMHRLTCRSRIAQIRCYLNPLPVGTMHPYVTLFRYFGFHTLTDSVDSTSLSARKLFRSEEAA